MKLDEQTREVLRKELPWLPFFLSEFIEEIRVQKLDLDTLNLVFGSDAPSFAELAGLFAVHLVDKDGVLIGNVGRAIERHKYGSIARMIRKMMRRRDLVFYTATYTFPETLDEALKRLSPESQKVQYVVDASKPEAVVYKVPKGTTITQHVANKAAEAEKRIKAFIAEI